MNQTLPRSLLALAVVDVLLLGAATAGALEVRSRAVTRERVLGRPWPARVTPTGQWRAGLEGTGRRVALTQVAGEAPGGLGRAGFTLGRSSIDHLALPDGSRWYPVGDFRLVAAGDLPFVAAHAKGDDVDVTVDSLSTVLARAPDPVDAVGRFRSPEGRQVERITMPRSTVVSSCSDRLCPREGPLAASLPAEDGTVLRAQSGVETGEAAVAGSIRAEALGRRWDGLVGAVEGHRLTSTATWDGSEWSLVASAEDAVQMWIDVWPVVDTMLSAESSVEGTGFFECQRRCSVRIRWTNTGFATSQVYEAEGLGAAGLGVGFDLNKSLGHDAGLGVRRGDREINLGDGEDVDSNQPPGDRVERGLTFAPGTEVTLVLRGNLPDVRVPLAIPPA